MLRPLNFQILNKSPRYKSVMIAKCLSSQLKATRVRKPNNCRKMNTLLTVLAWTSSVERHMTILTVIQMMLFIA